MKFEWDDKKNAENVKKHGVCFEQAVGIFSDPMAREQYDSSHSENEERYNIVGLANDILLFVVFTEPAPDTTRIISARKAETYELEDYYGIN